MWLLARTYSRGGWTGFLIGLAVLALSLPQRRQRLLVAVAAVVFTMMIAMLPAGLQRASTASRWETDRSVGNRLLVWKATLQMMAERPEGVGRGNFGRELERWYQPPELQAFYYAALNDFLTFAAERGLVLSAGALWALAAVLAGGWTAARRRDNAITLAAACGIGAFLIACMFSPLLFEWRVAWPAAALLGTVLWYWPQTAWRERAGRVEMALARPVLAGLLFSVAVLCSVYGAGFILLQSLPTRNHTFDLPGLARITVVEPRIESGKGLIVYLPDREENPEAVAKSTLRPLAARGWKVVCFSQPSFTVDALKHAREVVERLPAGGLDGSRRWYPAGHRQGGSVAIALAAGGVKLDSVPAARVAAFGVVAGSPFPEVSARAQVARLQIPLLLVHARQDAAVPPSHATKLAAANPSAKLVLISGDGDSHDAQWAGWIRAMAEWAH